MQANEERQGNLLQEYEQRFEHLSEDQKLSRLCYEAGMRWVAIGQLFYALPSPRGEENQSLCREYTMPRDQEGTCIKGWIQSSVRFGTTCIKVCNHSGRCSIEVQVQSLFQDQIVSWFRKLNGIDKFVREAMPIQEEEKASGETLCKSETNIKTVLNKRCELYSYWTQTMDWHWNTVIQWSLLFSSVKLHHLITTTQSKSSTNVQ